MRCGWVVTGQDLEDMKKRLKEIEEEAGALREMQAKVEKDMGAVQGGCLFLCGKKKKIWTLSDLKCFCLVLVLKLVLLFAPRCSVDVLC